MQSAIRTAPGAAEFSNRPCALPNGNSSLPPRREGDRFVFVLLRELGPPVLLLETLLPVRLAPARWGRYVFHGDFAAMPIASEMAYGIGLDAARYSLKSVCTEVPVLKLLWPLRERL